MKNKELLGGRRRQEIGSKPDDCGKLTPGQEEDWNNFLKIADTQRMIEVAQNTGKPVFAERALRILMEPYPGRLDFTNSELSRYYSNLTYCSWMESLPKETAQLAAKLLLTYIKQVDADMRLPQVLFLDRNKQTREYAKSSFYNYNLALIRLIPRVSDQTAQALFHEFNIRQPEGVMDRIRHHGYEPLLELLTSKLDNRWKRDGLDRLHAIAIDELKGAALPRKDQAPAIYQLRDIIKDSVTVRGRKLSPEILEEEVRFMMEQGKISLLTDFDILAGLLENLDNTDLLRTLVLESMAEETKNGSFWVDSSATMITAYRIMEKFADDREIVDYFSREREDYKKRMEAARERECNFLSDRDKIMRRLY